jgi:plastocyanin
MDDVGTETAEQASKRHSRRRFLQATAGVTALVGTTTPVAAQAARTHVVEMTDDLVFAPDSLTIAPGDTVIWENVGAIGHSVTAYEDSLPDDAAYFASGGFGSEQAARGAYRAGDPSSGDVVEGESYRHTFDVEGEYEYFCIPHETVGMVGDVEVVPGGAPVVEDVLPTVSDAAKTLALGASMLFASVLTLVYLFLKYGEEGPPEEGPGQGRRRSRGV